MAESANNELPDFPIATQLLWALKASLTLAAAHKISTLCPTASGAPIQNVGPQLLAAAGNRSVLNSGVAPSWGLPSHIAAPLISYGAAW